MSVLQSQWMKFSGADGNLMDQKLGATQIMGSDLTGQTPEDNTPTIDPSGLKL